MLCLYDSTNERESLHSQLLRGWKQVEKLNTCTKSLEQSWRTEMILVVIMAFRAKAKRSLRITVVFVLEGEHRSSLIVTFVLFATSKLWIYEVASLEGSSVSVKPAFRAIVWILFTRSLTWEEKEVFKHGDALLANDINVEGGRC